MPKGAVHICSWQLLLLITSVIWWWFQNVRLQAQENKKKFKIGSRQACLIITLTGIFKVASIWKGYLFVGGSWIVLNFPKGWDRIRLELGVSDAGCIEGDKLWCQIFVFICNAFCYLLLVWCLVLYNCYEPLQLYFLKMGSHIRLLYR